MTVWSHLSPITKQRKYCVDDEAQVAITNPCLVPGIQRCAATFPSRPQNITITDATLIVSRTDTKGRLTYFNDEFVQAAGFTEAELMGQPHNIVRHPDMPPEAFENLWTTLKPASHGSAR